MSLCIKLTLCHLPRLTNDAYVDSLITEAIEPEFVIGTGEHDNMQADRCEADQVLYLRMAPRLLWHFNSMFLARNWTTPQPCIEKATKLTTFIYLALLSIYTAASDRKY